MIPEIQLSTGRPTITLTHLCIHADHTINDFAGHLINQTNLAIKGIVALQAMSGAADVAGMSADAQNFSATASNYFKQWEGYVVGSSEHHTLLSYQWCSGYGLYNVYPDKLLGLSIIPEHIYAMQSDWYSTISQVFGIGSIHGTCTVGAIGNSGQPPHVPRPRGASLLMPSRTG